MGNENKVEYKKLSELVIFDSQKIICRSSQEEDYINGEKKHKGLSGNHTYSITDFNESDSVICVNK